MSQYDGFLGMIYWCSAELLKAYLLHSRNALKSSNWIPSSYFSYRSPEKDWTNMALFPRLFEI